MISYYTGVASFPALASYPQAPPLGMRLSQSLITLQVIRRLGGGLVTKLVQDMFQPIPGLISYTGVVKRLFRVNNHVILCTIFSILILSHLHLIPLYTRTLPSLSHRL